MHGLNESTENREPFQLKRCLTRIWISYTKLRQSHPLRKSSYRVFILKWGLARHVSNSMNPREVALSVCKTEGINSPHEWVCRIGVIWAPRASTGLVPNWQQPGGKRFQFSWGKKHIPTFRFLPFRSVDFAPNVRRKLSTLGLERRLQDGWNKTIMVTINQEDGALLFWQLLFTLQSLIGLPKWLQTKRGYLHGIGNLGAEHDGLDSDVDSTDGSWLCGVDVRRKLSSSGWWVLNRDCRMAETKQLWWQLTKRMVPCFFDCSCLHNRISVVLRYLSPVLLHFYSLSAGELQVCKVRYR